MDLDREFRKNLNDKRRINFIDFIVTDITHVRVFIDINARKLQSVSCAPKNNCFGHAAPPSLDQSARFVGRSQS